MVSELVWTMFYDGFGHLVTSPCQSLQCDTIKAVDDICL